MPTLTWQFAAEVAIVAFVAGCFWTLAAEIVNYLARLK
jgi:hypothetical protein